MSIAAERKAPWLLLMFSLPDQARQPAGGDLAQLRRYGALQLRTPGYLLPNSAENLERFEWLAAAIRKYKGQASVAQVHALDDLPAEQLAQMFVAARSRDYQALSHDLKKPRRSPAQMARLRRRFQEIVAIDFFNSPLRSRVEGLLAGDTEKGRRGLTRSRQQYSNRTWITRPRPGIDRVSPAWLIRRFIDPAAAFVFDNDPARHSDAVPFDIFPGRRVRAPGRGLHVRNPAQAFRDPRAEDGHDGADHPRCRPG
jgi:hypothetical protein